jgi:dTDP-4-dehydrorhamnose reductase
VHLLGSESGVAHSQASITDANAVAQLIAVRKPDVVFNCAAYNAVDRAESESAAAYATNADGPHNLAIACRQHGVALVHFSTNFVFDGAHDQPYVEADEPSPLSVYAASKLAGERNVLEVGAHVLVVRTAAVFGGPQSFPLRILERARSGQPLRVVSDQKVNPTYAKDLAAAALELAVEGVAGIVHTVNGGCTGWDELARATLKEVGRSESVVSVGGADYPTPARRPTNGCLATTRYRPLRPWREALHEWAAGFR